MYSCGPLHMDEQRLDVQLEPTYNSSVPIRDVDRRICRKQWTIGRSGERASGISVLIARHDDDDGDIYMYAYIYIYIYVVSWPTIVEGDPKAPFLIATTTRFRGGSYSLPWIAPLGPCLIMLSVKQGGIKCNFLVLGMTWPRIEPRFSGPLGTLKPSCK